MEPPTNATFIRQIPLIGIRDDQFYISQESQRFLSQIKNPLGVITIVGKYRTGKSLFLNKVLLNNSNGFKVSPTVNSCTKGLWISSQLLRTQTFDGQQIDVLVIDSEGIGAMEETNSYNNKILLFALLLSSYFIYNTVGSIDENSLNSLNLIVNMAKQIQSKNSNNDNIQDFFPSFLWVVRDFTLDLVSKDGYSISPKEYLEQALEIQKGSSDMIENKNKIRRMLKHFFKDRDCSTLIRPVETQQDLQNLNSISHQNIRSQFIQQTVALRSKIIKKVKVKKLKNKNMNGQMFVQLVKHYIDIINKGSIPNFQLTLKYLIRKESQIIMHNILQSKIKFIQINSQSMIPSSEIYKIGQKLIEQSINQINNRKIGSQEDLKQIYKKINEIIKCQIQKWNISNDRKCKNNFNEIFFQIMNSLTMEFKSLNQLNGFIKEKQKQLLNQTKQNPLNQELFQKMFYQWKCQQLEVFILSTEKTLNKQVLIAKQANISLRSEVSQSKQTINNLTNKIHQMEKNMLLKQAKYNQSIKIKQMQLVYLKQQYQENINQIDYLNKIIDGKSQQLQDKVNINYDQSKKLDEFNMMVKQLTDQKSFMKRQIDILKNTLNSKSNDLQQLRDNLQKVSMELQKSLQRQMVSSKCTKNQLENKSFEYLQLLNKYQILNKQYNSLSNLNKQIEGQLKATVQISDKEKLIYQNMFESFKESMKLEYQNRNQLIQTNKNLSSALKHLEHRAENAQARQKQLKQFKKCIKNCSCLQCQHCTKFFIASIFSQHLNICILGNNRNQDDINNLNEQKKLNIIIRQTLVRQSDSKPYTQYVIDIEKIGQKWTIYRKYKSFCDLNSNLKAAFPGVQLSDVSYIVNPHEGTKKSLLIEERRKLLEKYLNDLSNNVLVARNRIWQDFIEQPSRQMMCETNKQNDKNYVQQSPQQFLKIWNERNLRKKQASLYKKSLIN